MKFLLFLGLLASAANFFYGNTRYQSCIIGFYNLENLYDTIDNPATDDDEFLPVSPRQYNTRLYHDKLTRLAYVISQMGVEHSADGPALLGVVEIENDTVLRDLAKHPFIKDRSYRYVHYNSRDARGVDVALLFNPRYFVPVQSASLFVRLPGGSKESAFTRDILWVKGKLNGEVIHVYVNHWPSCRGGEVRSRPARAAAASVVRYHMDSIIDRDGPQKIIVMGDLNDDPISPAVARILGAKGKRKQLKENDLFNPWVKFYQKGIGSLAFDDNWNLFDQVILSSSWLNTGQPGYRYHRAYVFNKSFLMENTGRFRGYPMRTWEGNTYRGGYSDHFPTYVVLVNKKT